MTDSKIQNIHNNYLTDKHIIIQKNYELLHNNSQKGVFPAMGEIPGAMHSKDTVINDCIENDVSELVLNVRDNFSGKAGFRTKLLIISLHKTGDKCDEDYLS